MRGLSHRTGRRDQFLKTLHLKPRNMPIAGVVSDEWAIRSPRASIYAGGAPIDIGHGWKIHDSWFGPKPRFQL